jgi:hypothetical protein
MCKFFTCEIIDYMRSVMFLHYLQAPGQFAIISSMWVIFLNWGYEV